MGTCRCLALSAHDGIVSLAISKHGNKSHVVIPFDGTLADDHQVNGGSWHNCSAHRVYLVLVPNLQMLLKLKKPTWKFESLDNFGLTHSVAWFPSKFFYELNTYYIISQLYNLLWKISAIDEVWIQWSINSELKTEWPPLLKFNGRIKTLILAISIRTEYYELLLIHHCSLITFG